MIYESIRVSIDAGIAHVELHRPERRNAYTPDMGEELVHAIGHAIEADEVRVVILSGAGQSFCAGADREFLTGKLGKYGVRLGEESFINTFSLELIRAPKPLIAAIQGAAVGIGSTMLLAFDLRIAASDAIFSFPFAHLGMVPGLGATHLLQRLTGYAKAAEIIFSNATLSAQEALEIGLVNKVVPTDQLLSHARAMAEKIMESPRQSIAAAKRSLAFAAHSSLGAAMANERKENEELRGVRAAIVEAYAANPKSRIKSSRGLH